MSPMVLENINNVEVGESLPPSTEHVGLPKTSYHASISLTQKGCQRFTTDMEGQRRIRGGRRVGHQ